jgi:poly(A) polymerase
VVGGGVRDVLLDRPVTDWDVATDALPEVTLSLFPGSGYTNRFGTVTVPAEGQRDGVQVTTFRRDHRYADHRRPDEVTFTDSIEEDLARRDFTINALYADPSSGEIFDYFGGLGDLQQRHVRFIGEPLARIAEDHLRILRFFRFHARFGSGDLDREALDACTARANDLMALSRERIADELLKLLGLPDPAPTVAVMLDRAILRPVLPEIDAAALAILERVIAGEREAGIEADPLRRLAALLPPGPLLAEKIAVRLKLSNKARKRLSCAAERELGSDAQALAYRVGVGCAADRLLLAGQPAEAATLTGWRPPRLPIGGGVLIARGVPEGPAVARMLRQIEDRWVEAGFPHGDAFERIVAELLASPL